MKHYLTFTAAFLGITACGSVPSADATFDMTAPATTMPAVMQQAYVEPEGTSDASLWTTAPNALLSMRRAKAIGVSMDDTRPARLVRRNQLVTVKFVSGALEITTTGRAMGEATEDEAVAILNLNSKKIVNGIVQKDGWVLVQ